MHQDKNIIYYKTDQIKLNCFIRNYMYMNTEKSPSDSIYQKLLVYNTHEKLIVLRWKCDEIKRRKQSEIDKHKTFYY